MRLALLITSADFYTLFSYKKIWQIKSVVFLQLQKDHDFRSVGKETC